MAKQHVVATVRAVLDAWAPASGSKPAIAYPNGEGETPQDASPYLVVQFPVANQKRTTFGRTYVEEGAARVVILAERGGGTDWPLARGEEIAALFRSLKKDGVEFLTPSSPLMNDDNDDGNYFRASVVIPYLYHFDDPE